jgi:hypothetical protein
MGLSSSLKKIGNVATLGLFNKQKGPSNPYGAPNLEFLKDTSKIDYLKNPDMFKFLLDPSRYNFLNDPSKSMPTTVNRGSESQFGDYISRLNAPSSVDAVRSEVDNDLMSYLLGGVDEDTKKAIGSLKMDFADRGLSGPGVASDIEGQSLGNTYEDAIKAKGQIRGEFASKNLDRLAEREKAVADAYGTRYQAGVGYDIKDAELGEAAAERGVKRDLSYADLLRSGTESYGNIAAEREALFAKLLNERDLGYGGVSSKAYSEGEDRKYQYAKPSPFEDILRNVRLGFNFGGG